MCGKEMIIKIVETADKDVKMKAIFYLSSSENKAWKKFRPVRDLNPLTFAIPVPVKIPSSPPENFFLNYFEFVSALQ